MSNSGNDSNQDSNNYNAPNNTSDIENTDSPIYQLSQQMEQLIQQLSNTDNSPEMLNNLSSSLFSTNSNESILINDTVPENNPFFSMLMQSNNINSGMIDNYGYDNDDNDDHGDDIDNISPIMPYSMEQLFGQVNSLNQPEVNPNEQLIQMEPDEENHIGELEQIEPNGEMGLFAFDDNSDDNDEDNNADYDDDDNNDDDNNDDVEDDDGEDDVDDDNWENVPAPNPVPYQQYFSSYSYGGTYKNSFLKDIDKIRAGISTNTWLHGLSMTKFQAESEDDADEFDIMRTQNMSIIIEQISSIMECIPEDIKDQNSVKLYMNEISIHFNGVIEHLSQFDSYEFTPIEIFLWISIMEACKLEPQIIPFLSCHEMMTSDIIRREGYAGLNCLRYSCTAESSSGLEQLLGLNCFDTKDLLSPDPNGYNAIMWAAAFSPFVTDYIISNKIVSQTDFWSEIDGNSVEPFMIACEKGSMSASMILKSSYMKKEYFDKDYYKQRSALMAAACANTELGKELLSHEWCTQEYFERKDTVYNATVFHLACHENTEMAMYLLGTDFITKEILSHKFGSANNEATCLSYSAKNYELMKAIFEHSEFSSDMITIDLSGSSLLFSIACCNKETLLFILNSDKISENDLKIESNGNNFLTWMIKKHVSCDIIFEFVNHEKFSKDIITYAHNNKTVFNILCPSQYQSYTNAQDVLDYQKSVLQLLIKSKYVTPEYIKENIFGFIGIHPKFAVIQSLLEHNKISAQMLIDLIAIASTDEDDDIIHNCPLYVYLTIKCQDVVQNIINYETITVDSLLATAIDGENYFLTVAKFKPMDLKYIINSTKCTSRVLECVDKDKNNALQIILQSNLLTPDDKVQLTQLIINNDECTETIVNNKNIKNETPFITGIKTCFEAAEIIKLSNKFKNDEFIDKDTCLDYLKSAISSFNISGVKVITTLPGFNDDALLIEDENKETCYHYAAKSTKEIFEYMIQLNSYDSSVLSKINNKGNSCFSIAIEHSPDIAGYLLDNNLVTKDIFIHSNSNCYNPLNVACFLKKTNIVKKIVAHSHMSPDVMSHKTNLEHNIFGYNEITDEILLILIKSDHFDISMIKELKNLKIPENDQEISTTIPIYMDMVYSGRIDPVAEILKRVEDSSIFESVDSYNNNIVLASSPHKGLCTTILNHKFITTKSIMQQNLREESIIMLLMDLNDDYNINILLQLSIFDPKILTLAKKDGHTMLNYIKPNSTAFSTIVNSGHLKKEFTDSFIDEDDDNMCMALSKMNYIHLDELLSSNLVSEDTFMHKNNKNLSLSSYLLQYDKKNNTELFKKSLTLEFYSDNIANQTMSTDTLPLLYFTLTFQSDFSALIQSKYDLTKSFDDLYENNNIHAMMSFLCVSSFDCFKLYTESKYFKLDHLLAKDKYNHNIVTSFLLLEEQNLEWIIKNPLLWVDDVKYYGDIDNDNLLMFISNKYDRLEFLLKNNYVDTKMINLINNYGNNIFGYLIQHNRVNEFKLLDEYFSVVPYLDMTNYKEHNLLHIACDKSHDILDYMYSKGYISYSLLNSHDKMNVSLFMKLIQHCQDTAKKIIATTICTKEVFNKIDSEGKTCLMYAAQYAPFLIRPIVDHENYDKNLISCRSYTDDYTCIDYGAIFNSDSVIEFLVLDECTPDLLQHGHMDYGSTLSLAARYQPEALKAILNWDKTTWKLVMTVNEYSTFLQISAVYNHLSLQYAIDSKWDLNLLFMTLYKSGNSDEHDSVPILAAKYQPEGLLAILNSKYCTENIMGIYSSERKLCHHYALECQPKSLYYLIESENDIIKSLLSIPYDNGYRVLDTLKLGNTGINNLKDAVEKLPLLKVTNERCSDESHNACPICYGYKKNVCFLPCVHVTCAACALKLKKCPACRKSIKSKELLY